MYREKMRPRFHPRLVNGPFEDPGLFIPFLFEKRALLFDLGDNHRLSSRDLLKLTHIFISHTHMDHFIGFDHLLRLLLGRNKTLWLFGPDGFLNNLEGKLSAYAWNLLNSYDHPLIIKATEIRHDCHLSQTYHCAEQFRTRAAAKREAANAIVWQEPEFIIERLFLDHDLPCLGFCLKERFHINICKSGLDKLGLATGPWLTDFKSALYNQADPGLLFHPPTQLGVPSTKPMSLETLRKTIAVITPGQKVAYITDTSYDRADEMIAFAKGADHLFIEAAFLHRHHVIADRKKHLTARQAGTLARAAGVKRLTIFHFSPRYSDEGELLEVEAKEAFLG